MKKTLCGLVGLLLASSALADEVKTLTVTGDRVSLRAAPKINAVLLDRAMRDDPLVLMDDTHPEWVGVRAPDRIDVWVTREYVQDGVVVPALLNARSGPSLSHEVLGTLRKGEVLNVRSELDGWLRIAPTTNLTVWISRQFTSLTPNKESIIQVIPESAPSVGVDILPEDSGVKVVIQPEINQVLIAAAEVTRSSGILEADPSKEQGVVKQFSGTLQKAGATLYKLVDPTDNQVVRCYVRGNMSQLKLLDGRSLTISGGTYWALGLTEPLLVPKKIEVRKRILAD